MNIEQTLSIRDLPVDVTGATRWEVYHRLQSLQISCQCSTDRPLRVSIATPTDLIQLWSVLRQNGSSRPILAGWLETCWRSNSEKN